MLPDSHRTVEALIHAESLAKPIAG